MNSFFTLHSFLEVSKTHDLPSKFWQTLGDALSNTMIREHLQELPNFIGKFCVLSTSKTICQVKKSSSPTVWHN
jgi:hypothetical protein